MADYLSMIEKAIASTLALPDTYFRDLPDTPSFPKAKSRKVRQPGKQASAYKRGKGYKTPSGWRVFTVPLADRQK